MHGFGVELPPRRLRLHQPPDQPDQSREKSKALMLERLAKRPMPIGSETKYFHAIEFYNAVETAQKFGEPKT